jgi:protein SCO1/2
MWIILGLACTPAIPETVEIPVPESAEQVKESLYQLKIPLTGPQDENIAWDLYKGHPTLVSMFYTQCTQACPMLIARIQSIEAKLPTEERENLRVLLISMDPEHDTSERLRKAMEEHQIDPQRWKFARPHVEDVRMIAAILDIRYRSINDGGFSHSSVVTLLDKNGQQQARLEGLGADELPFIQKIHALY